GTGVGTRSWCSWSLHSLVFDQAQVDGVLAVLPLEDANRRGYAVGDPEDGLVVAAIGALHAHGLVAQLRHGHRLGLVGDAVGMVAYPPAVDEPVVQDLARLGVADHGQVDQQPAHAAVPDRRRRAALLLDVAGPLRGIAAPVVGAGDPAVEQ